MRNRLIGAAVLAALVTFAATALAADAVAQAAPQNVTAPYGDWIASALTASATIVVSLAGFIAHRFLPPALKLLITDSVISKGVDYAIAATAGAVRGKEAHIDLTNEIIATAARWVIGNEPKIASWAGANLQPLIIARLSALGVVPAEASAATLELRDGGSASA